MGDALTHIEEAIRLLGVDVERIGIDGEPGPGFQTSVAIDLDRVDRAIGPSGESMFGALAITIQAAFVELLAARQALKETRS